MLISPQKLKNKVRDGSITAEIEKILTDVYNTKIANELSEINTELNSKLTAEIEKFKARDNFDRYALQKSYRSGRDSPILTTPLRHREFFRWSIM